MADDCLTIWAQQILMALEDCGVRHAVVSPGSRNTPLTWAALSSGLQCHSVVDERSAGFFALGVARATGHPAALICTSGSALAHYLPAIIEARYAHLPLLILSADRPSELQEAGAPQTIQQRDVFAATVRRCLDLGDPRSEPWALAAVRRKVARAVDETLSPWPGAVHLNVPARKPLEPVSLDTAGASRPHTPVVRSSTQQAAPQALQALAEQLQAARAPLISVGPVPSGVTATCRRLADGMGAAFACETPGWATPVEAWARSEGLCDPDVIVHVGPVPVSSGWQAFLERSQAPLVMLCAGEAVDPFNRACQIITGALGPAVASLVQYLERALANHEPPGEGTTADKIQSLLPALRMLLGEMSFDTEPQLVAQLLESVPQGGQLVLGNSLPIRIASWVSPVCELKEFETFTQRGASGIDGLIAGAVGAAQAGCKPTLLVIGDVSAQHDIGSLALLRGCTQPLVVAIIDNGGGRIFDHLPLARSLVDDPRFDMWRTPTNLDWTAIARGFGVDHEVAHEGHQIKTTVERLLDRQRASLLILKADSRPTRDFLQRLGTLSASGPG